LNSGGAFDDRPDWLRLETTTMSPEDAAERIIVHFDLPRADSQSDIDRTRD